MRNSARVFLKKLRRRSARLGQSLEAPWPKGLRVDSFEDLAASKMEALVARGAPRDFRDIFALCQERISNPAKLWELWARRRTAAREEADRSQAALAVRTNLERIEKARPLENIEQQNDREAAEQLRAWFSGVFLHGLV